MKLEQGQRLVMIGDSITDCGRARPIGEGLGDALGKGYVAIVDALLRVSYPERPIRVTNVGSSGNTVCDLADRWRKDVLELEPDWLSVCIGVNDVWRQFDLPQMPEECVPVEQYEETYDQLLTETRPQLKGLVLATPFYIEPNRADAMRARMDEYGAVVKKLAEKHAAVFVDVQAAFDRLLEHHHSSAIAWDRVHPTQTGHAAIARAWLNAMGYQW